MRDRPIRVTLANDYELVVSGLHAMLAPHRDRVRVVEHVVGDDEPTEAADVVLFDTYGRRDQGAPDVARLAAHPLVGAVVVFGWDNRPGAAEFAVAAGATGFVSKRCTTEELIAALESVADGGTALAHRSVRARRISPWPGAAAGLTERESEVLVLLAHGLSNREIAASLFVSPDTIKHHLRNIFRKVGARNRLEAAHHVLGDPSFTQFPTRVPDDRQHTS